MNPEINKYIKQTGICNKTNVILFQVCNYDEMSTNTTLLKIKISSSPLMS